MSASFEKWKKNLRRHEEHLEIFWREYFLWSYVNFNDENNYVFQNGIVTIPKSTKAERIEENCKVRLSYAVKFANIQTTVFHILVCLSVVL